MAERSSRLVMGRARMQARAFGVHPKGLWEQDMWRHELPARLPSGIYGTYVLDFILMSEICRCCTLGRKQTDERFSFFAF